MTENQRRKTMDKRLTFIGEIRTPYETLDQCPRNVQPDGPLCRLVLDNNFKEGLEGLLPGQQILILYWFDGVDRTLTRQPARGTGAPMGTFALRSPHRPNPIGAAVLIIEDIDETQVMVRGLDCLDRTPLLDIKPHTH